MSLDKDVSTLVCLFHTHSSAQAAMQDLQQVGTSQSEVTLIGGPDAPADSLDRSELASFGMPDKDYDHLKDGIRDGGMVLAVKTASANSSAVEAIFAKHSAAKIDEATRSGSRQEAPALPLAAAAPLAADGVAGGTVIPIVAEELVVGKRTVEQGGVRVFRRTVETPVEQTIQLREEHVVLDRRPVDRAVSDTDRAFNDRSIELTGTAEEAVVSKRARVVEEVVVGKQASEHVETVHDTVRRTEVDVEEVPASSDTVRRG